MSIRQENRFELISRSRPYQQQDPITQPSSSALSDLYPEQPQAIFSEKPANPQQKSSLWAGLKSWLIENLTEEAELDRPIGIRQLSRQTFAPVTSQAVFPGSSTGGQNYRFTQGLNVRRGLYTR